GGVSAATVAIVGAGIGGVYLAAELGRNGHRVRLTDLDDSRLAPIRDRGGIEIDAPERNFPAVERAANDLPAALAVAALAILATGGTFQEGAARMLAPLLKDGQLILLVQGNTGGALVVRRALDAAGCRARVDIAEMDNYPYSAWRLAPARIRPIVRKRWLQV